MAQATIIGIDLAKSTFQLHGAAADDAIVFRKKLPRDMVLSFLAAQPSALVAMRPARALITGAGRSRRSAMR